MGSNLITIFIGTGFDLSNKVLENNQMGSIEYVFVTSPFWMVGEKVEIGSNKEWVVCNERRRNGSEFS